MTHKTARGRALQSAKYEVRTTKCKRCTSHFALCTSHFVLCSALLLALLACAFTLEGQENSPPVVILISLDGFRHDYLDRINTPHLGRLVREGVRARALIPVYPTKTFPSHYSMVTGLYPENHGILSNAFYDPDLDLVFRFRDREQARDSRWWGGEPIWVTARKQAKISATFFWPGSDVTIGGMQPTYWKPFDSRIPPLERIHQILHWLDWPAGKRPALICAYFNEPDVTGHRFGPDSPEVAAAVQESDRLLGHLVGGLEARKLLDQVNLLVVSDHGMAELDPQQVIFVEDYVDLRRCRLIETGSILQLWPDPDYEEVLFGSLKKAHPRLSVYRKEEIPDRLRFGNHRRAPRVLGIPQVGWQVLTRETYDPQRFLKGSHGFDNRDPSMHGIFIARGPAFRRGSIIDPFVNVEIYNLLAHILGISPVPNDGSFESIRFVLSQKAISGAGGE